MLEHLTPKEFEAWCQLVFERTYGCLVRDSPFSGDEGRDLVIDHPEGLIVVECKHQPGASVGRPVVQKLHSAVLTAGAKKGIIATTGSFARTVQDYVARLEVKIELLDANKLAFLAEKVGIPTAQKGAIAPDTALAFPTVPEAQFAQEFGGAVLTAGHFSPGRLPQPLLRAARRTEYAGYFLGRFTAAGQVNTAVGTAQEDWSGSVWLQSDGSRAGTGPPPGLDPGEHTFVPLGRALAAAPGPTPPPKVQLLDANRQLKEYLLASLGRTFTYTGRNNQRYSRVVRPSARATSVEATRLLYVPSQSFNLEIGGTSHPGLVRESTAGFLVSSRTLTDCTMCRRVVRQPSQIICAACFKPAHRRTFLHPDSNRCTVCGALICHRDARQGTRGTECAACAGPQAKPLGPGWKPHLVLAILSFFFSLAAAGILHVENYVFSYVAAPVFIGLLAWLPLLFVATNGNGQGTDQWQLIARAPLNAHPQGAQPPRFRAEMTTRRPRRRKPAK